jgi:hypothetical protein
MVITPEIPSSLRGTGDIRYLIAWHLPESATEVKDEIKW